MINKSGLEYLEEQLDRIDFEIYQRLLSDGHIHSFRNNDELLRDGEIRNSFVEWVDGLCDWRYFLTLTFKNEVGGDVAFAKWRSLVKLLNRRLFGRHYTKCVGHSYFSYCLGVEMQRRDVIHFHVLVDRPIDMTFIHSYWGDIAGLCWIDKINARLDVVRYVTKYVLKGGDVLLYRAVSRLTPRSRPIWWDYKD